MFLQIHITILTKLLQPKAHLSNSLQNYVVYGTQENYVIYSYIHNTFITYIILLYIIIIRSYSYLF